MTPSAAQVTADFATVLIGIGTVLCLKFPPRAAWGNPTSPRGWWHRALISLAVGTLTTGIVMSGAAILMRDGGGYFVGLLVSVAAVLTITGVVYGVDAWVGTRKAAKASQPDDVAHEVQL